MKTNEKNNKKEARAKETYVRIVQAAVKLFARQGYHKTTISDLAQAIGLTSGAIFHHFPNKEAILEAVVDWLERGIRIYSDITDRAERGSIEVVEEVVRVMCAHFKRNPEATICLAALATEFAGGHHPLETRLKEIYEVFVKSFANCLRNHPRVSDPRAAAVAFFGSVQGIAVQGLLREGNRRSMSLPRGF